VTKSPKAVSQVGIFIKSGTSHDIRWRAIDNLTSGRFILGVDEDIQKMSLYFRETNFWDDLIGLYGLKEKVDRRDVRGCKFEVFIPPGKLILLIEFFLCM